MADDSEHVKMQMADDRWTRGWWTCDCWTFRWMRMPHVAGWRCWTSGWMRWTRACVWSGGQVDVRGGAHIDKHKDLRLWMKLNNTE